MYISFFFKAFSELDKLKPHIIKHTPGALPTFMQKTENINNNNNNDDTEEIAQHPPGKKRFYY